MTNASIEKSSPRGKNSFIYSRLYLFPEKFRSGWTGPFVVVKVFPRSATEIKGPTNDYIFMVNGRRLKEFLEMPGEDVECLSLYKSSQCE